jgi:hypothetical protein
MMQTTSGAAAYRQLPRLTQQQQQLVQRLPHQQQVLEV